LEEQFAASVETGLRDTDDCNADENFENMCFKNHTWQNKQLKSKGITSLTRPSIAHFIYRDLSSTADVKPIMKFRLGIFGAGAFTFKPPCRIDDTSPLKRVEKMLVNSRMSALTAGPQNALGTQHLLLKNPVVLSACPSF